MSSDRPKKQRWKRGAIVQIPLGNGHRSYAQMLDNPEYAFFDVRSETDVPLAEVAAAPVLFRLWVMRCAHFQGRWQKVGLCDVELSLSKPIQRFNQDPITGKIRLTYDGCEGPEASVEQCVGVESAAVWDPDHVEDRLRDHYRGVPNKWVESLRPKPNT